MSTALPRRVCRIIAGPNGAGKTTFALKYLPDVAPGTAFVNADLIAAGLSPLAPEQQLFAASRLFLQQIERHVHAPPQVHRLAGGIVLSRPSQCGDVPPP